jgi:hypothetical protein
MRQWLAEGMSGCRFASLIGQRRERFVAAAYTGVAREVDVARIFEYGIQECAPVLALFPDIRTEAALVEQLRALARGARWRITRQRPPGLVTDDVLIGVAWQIGNGCSTSVMGLAPFATMPVTRRAPYVCLAAWPGGHDNPHWTRYEADIVHFLDTDLSALKLTTAKSRSLTKASVATTALLLSELDDDARYYRRAAFRLQPLTAAALDDVLASHD